MSSNFSYSPADKKRKKAKKTRIETLLGGKRGKKQAMRILTILQPVKL